MRIDPKQLSSSESRTRRNLMGAASVAGLLLMSAALKPNKAFAGRREGWDNPNCFLKGTKIQTASGPRKIEDLKVGDRLPTLFGGTQSIQWISSRRYQKSDPTKPWVTEILPIRVARHAFDSETPRSDLLLTGGHAIYVEGVLVPVSEMINGTTVRVVDPEEFETLEALEYFHIKLSSHDVIYAEGVPCETLVTVDERDNNFAEYFRIYGEPAEEPQTCAPVLAFCGGRQAIKSRLRSAMSPWIDRRTHLDIVRDKVEEGTFVIA
jgi:hypothetical protein